MKKSLWLILAMILFLLTLWIIIFFPKEKLSNNLCVYDYVKKVYDGDTVLTSKLWKVRLLWIDSPEIYYSGRKIKSYKFYWCSDTVKQIAEEYLNQKEILFCADSLADDKWFYGRYLRYAMIASGDKKIPFGYILLEKWYAKVYKKASFSWKEKYLNAEKQAKEKKIWIWSEKCINEDKEIKEKYAK